MSELLQVVTALSRAALDRQVSVLATVVRTEGSTYRRIGARMVAFPDGSHVGAVSAGCIESDVLLRAERVRRTGAVELATYNTSSPEDLIWGSGTACGGVTQLLLQPLDPEQAAARARWLRDVAQLRRRYVLATVIRTSGGVPLEPGDQAVLPHAGARLVGFEALPPRFRLTAEATARRRLQAHSSSAVSHAWAAQEVDIAYEVRSPRMHLCVCGAGPDAVPLVAIARLMGWQVTLIDHRPAMFSTQHWGDVDRILLRSPDEAFDAVERADPDAAVVMSHNYERDLLHVEALLAAGVPYIGVLGPRHRTRQMLDDLKMSDADAAGLYAPVGLDIGAETPQEIAVAIVAEVQAVSADRPGAPLRERPGAIHYESPALEPARY